MGLVQKCTEDLGLLIPGPTNVIPRFCLESFRFEIALKKFVFSTFRRFFWFWAWAFGQQTQEEAEWAKGGCLGAQRRGQRGAHAHLVAVQ